MPQTAACNPERRCADAATQTPWKIVVVQGEGNLEHEFDKLSLSTSSEAANQHEDSFIQQQTFLEILLEFNGMGGKDILRCSSVCRCVVLEITTLACHGDGKQ
jgi:hypothetical protein